MEKNPITTNGFENLKKQLTFLKNVERIKITNDIKIAREHGDLKENAEYHAAREQQYLIEKKITELEKKIVHAQIIDPTNQKTTDKIIFGSIITIINLETQKEHTYEIVGEDEIDIKNNKISIKSPLARAAIQKSIGDIIKVTTPIKTIIYKITNIK